MVHLHVHSNHSLLRGTGTIERLVQRAAKWGMSALALTDSDGLYGAVPFYKAARAADIKPILGVCLNSVVLLARDRQGYSDLCRIVTEYYLDEEFRLAEALQSARVFVLTGDRNRIETFRQSGICPLVAITHWGDVTSRYHAGQLRDYALEKGLRPVAVCPAYMVEEAEWLVQRVLSAIRDNTTIDDLREGQCAPPGAWLRPPDAMQRLYGQWPETLANTEWVAERCNVELELGRPLFPEIELPQGETPFSSLWKQAFRGVRKHYRPLTPVVIDRLKYELDIIHQLGFAAYFLIVWDIVRFARRNGISVVGRGSAANSMVAYGLGITRVDPFKYDLYFERFMNLARTDCPDIDLDICWRRRDQVIDYVYDKYGAERVAMICTLNTFRARSSVREVARAFGLTDEEIRPVSGRLPHYHASDIRTLVRRLPECRGLPFHREPWKSILEISEFIDGFPRHLSIHSGGLVIAPQPLTRFTPLQRAAKGIRITQYDMHPIEELGLVKMDLLGHRSLTVIDESVQMIRANRKIGLDIERVADADRLTGRLLREGRTIGCFQIESPAMRALLRNTLADNTDMLIKTLSLVRPGPSGSGMKKHFIDRHLGREETVYLHPSLERILGDTYGVMLYQEDILKVANAIACMDLAEADAFRRVMTKKRGPEEMARYMRLFLKKARQNGVDEQCAEEIWTLMSNFAEYSYCKAHASTYGELAYQCSYLKAHFPAEFLAAVLSNRGGFYHPAVYLEEAKRMGVLVLPPDVNHSGYAYTVEGDAIRVGLVEIRDLSRQGTERIVAERQAGLFSTLDDLWQRTGLVAADLEALVRAGACDGLGWSRSALFWQIQRLKEQGRRSQGDAEQLLMVRGQMSRPPALPDHTRRDRCDAQWHSLGFLTGSHPLEYYLPDLRSRALVSSVHMNFYAGRRVTMVGWLIADRRVGLKQGRGCMKFLTMEDAEGVFEAILFPSAYQRYGHLLTSHGPFFVHGEVQVEDHCPTLSANWIERVGERPKDPGASELTPPGRWLRRAFEPAAVDNEKGREP